ncbi:MAG TPA: hypothetical protein VE263_04685 [Candidatus Angelobacter sp.]|nr:hypothetical protein [Candidatus Angelobacter sp.]
MASLPLSSRTQSRTGFPGASASQPGTLALSVEFVAKPEKAASAKTFLPGALHGALNEVDGFAGCVVLSADQESRLVTVITFWTGSDSRKCCSQNVRWVKALVASYADRCVRVQTLVAHAPQGAAMAAETLDGEAVGAETIEEETGSMMQECGAEEGNLCIA